MKFKKYVKESVTPDNKLNLNEDFFNPDAPSLTRDEIDKFYAPVEKMIRDGKFDEARKEIAEMEADIADIEATNSKKKFFRLPQFMIDGQKRQLAALKAKIPQNESIEDMDRRCEKCNTLLNDGGTCPKCDDGEEDIIEEELSVREKLKKAYPELNFDTPVVTEEVVSEELSNKEKLKRAFPELNFDGASEINEECVKEEMSNREKLKRAFPELNFDTKVEESVEEDSYSDYDDDYEIEDDVEMDRRHAALYGGDRMYCNCGHKLSYNEYGSYCPVCEPADPEAIYEDSDDSCRYDDNM